MSVATKYVRSGEPSRYRLAAVITAIVVAILIVSSYLDYASLRGVPARPVLLGLPAALLVAVATYFAVRGLARGEGLRRPQLVAAAVLFAVALVLWLLVLNVYVFTRDAGPVAVAASTLACIPTTAFGLWVVRRLDMNEKEPWRLVLVAAGWGALVATSLVISVEGLWDGVAFRLLVPGPGLTASIALSAGLFEELAKGLAVLLLFLVMRDEFDDVVDGIVYGAAVGLGFNFMESIGYMTYLFSVFGHDGALAAGFQWYARQVLGLFFGHATYTALFGAGLGIARQTANRKAALLVGASGWLAAIAAHFSWDAWQAFFPISHSAVALVEIHLRTLIMSGPFTAAVVAHLVLGLDREGRALRAELEQEAGLQTGAVLPPEIPILTHPWRRFKSRLSWLARKGPAAYFRVARLQQAQIELAIELWHRARQETELAPEAEQAMRARIATLRQRLAG